MRHFQRQRAKVTSGSTKALIPRERHDLIVGGRPCLTACGRTER